MKNLLIKKQNIFILISIIFLGIYLRFRNLTLDSFWLDELFSMDFSNPNRNFSEMVRLTLEDVHPPFYQFLLWIWLKFFGFTEFAGRSLSAFIGTLTIIVSYYFTKDFYKEKVALAVSFIFSINIFLIFFSNEVRAYQLTILLCMLSYLYLYRTVLTKDKKNLYLYWFFTIIWMYTHYYSFFIIATQLIFVLIYIFIFEKDFKKLFIFTIQTSIIFILSIIPLIPYLFATTQGDKFWFIKKPAITYFINYIHFYFGYGGLFFVLFGFLFTLYYLLTERIEKKEKIFLIMLFIWFIFGYLIPYINSILTFPLVQARYSIVMIPPIILIALYGISKQKNIFQIILLFIFAIFSFKVIFIDFGNKLYKQQYREPLIYVSKYSSIPIYELIPENGHNGNNTNHFQVYSDMLDLNLNIINDDRFRNDYKENKLPKCFWTIYTFYSPTLKKTEDVLTLYELSKNEKFNKIYTKEYNDSQASLFSKKGSESECLKYLKLRD